MYNWLGPADLRAFHQFTQPEFSILKGMINTVN